MRRRDPWSLDHRSPDRRPPPGRLYSIPKAGGDAALLLEGPDYLLTPLAVVDDRVIAQRSNPALGLLAVAKDGSESETIVPGVPSERAKVVDGQVYWYVEGEDSSVLLDEALAAVHLEPHARVDGLLQRDVWKAQPLQALR